MVKANADVLNVLQARICRKALKRRLRGGFGWGFYRLEPFESPINKKRETRTTSFRISLFWRKRGDSNPWAREDYTISNRARYDHFDTLPYYVFILKICRDFYRQLFYFICFLFKCQLFFKRFIKLFKVFWFYSLARRFSCSLCSVNFDINHLLNKFWYDTIP